MDQNSNGSTNRFSQKVERVPEPPRLAPPILVLDRVDIGYGTSRILKNVSLSVDMDDSA